MSEFKNTLTHKIIKERWNGKDMEQYFHQAVEEFYQKLKKEMRLKIIKLINKTLLKL